MYHRVKRSAKLLGSGTLYDERFSFHAHPAWFHGMDMSDDTTIEIMVKDAFANSPNTLWNVDDWRVYFNKWLDGNCDVTHIPMDKALYNGWVKTLAPWSLRYTNSFPPEWLATLDRTSDDSFGRDLGNILSDYDLLDRRGKPLWTWPELTSHLRGIALSLDNPDMDYNPFVNRHIYNRLRNKFDPRFVQQRWRNW